MAKSNPYRITTRHRWQAAEWWEGRLMRARRRIIGKTGLFIGKGDIVVVTNKTQSRLDVQARQCDSCGCVVRMAKLKFNLLEFASQEQAKIK